MKKLIFALVIIFNTDLVLGAAAGDPNQNQSWPQWAKNRAQAAFKWFMTEPEELEDQEQPKQDEEAIQVIAEREAKERKLRELKELNEGPALNEAISSGNDKVAKELLENGANPGIVDSQNRNALDNWAYYKESWGHYKNKDIDLLKLLLASEILPNNKLEFIVSINNLDHKDKDLVVKTLYQYILDNLDNKEQLDKLKSIAISQLPDMPKDLTSIIIDYVSPIK